MNVDFSVAVETASADVGVNAVAVATHQVVTLICNALSNAGVSEIHKFKCTISVATLCTGGHVHYQSRTTRRGDETTAFFLINEIHRATN